MRRRARRLLFSKLIRPETCVPCRCCIHGVNPMGPFSTHGVRSLHVADTIWMYKLASRTLAVGIRRSLGRAVGDGSVHAREWMRSYLAHSSLSIPGSALVKRRLLPSAIWERESGPYWRGLHITRSASKLASPAAGRPHFVVAGAGTRRVIDDAVRTPQNIRTNCS